MNDRSATPTKTATTTNPAATRNTEQRQTGDEALIGVIDPVDRDGLDSFPASDPPAHWAAAPPADER